MKFGGSSVATSEKMKKVSELILKRKSEYDDVVVVVSAMGKTTNNLIALANELSDEPNKRDMDMLLSTGEMVSASLISIYLNSIGHKAIALTGFQSGFKTIGEYSKSRIENVDTERLESELNDGKIVIVTGFQGMNELGDITTLGRGGSDTSAVALAASLDASCEIYTDVKGIYTVDPRIRPKARKLEYITYEETMEMANLGAKVIEPRSVEMASKYSVPLYIALNTGDVKGTYISTEVDNLEKSAITNISKIDGVLLVSMSEQLGVDSKITECFVELADQNINLDIISHSLDDEGKPITSFTSTVDNKSKIDRILNNMDIKHRFTEDVSKVSIIGTAMRNQVGVAARAFKVFLNEHVDFYEVSTSEISISYVVDSANSLKIVNALADEFNL